MPKYTMHVRYKPRPSLLTPFEVEADTMDEAMAKTNETYPNCDVECFSCPVEDIATCPICRCYFDPHDCAAYEIVNEESVCGTCCAKYTDDQLFDLLEQRTE